jgi:hypothetical protein
VAAHHGRACIPVDGNIGHRGTDMQLAGDRRLPLSGALMGTSGDDAGCPARDYIDWNNGRRNLPAMKHSDSRSASLSIKSHHRFISRKEHDMTTQHHQVITKILIGAAVALSAYLGGAAPVRADGNPIGSAPNPFGGLSCSCRETAPPGSPALREGVDRGIREGRTAWLLRLHH